MKTNEINQTDKPKRYLETIGREMSSHKMNCCRAFHRDCDEFIKLGKEYIEAGGTIQSWNPYEYDKKSDDKADDKADNYIVVYDANDNIVNMIPQQNNKITLPI